MLYLFQRITRRGSAWKPERESVCAWGGSRTNKENAGRRGTMQSRAGGDGQ